MIHDLYALAHEMRIRMIIIQEVISPMDLILGMQRSLFRTVPLPYLRDNKKGKSDMAMFHDSLHKDPSQQQQHLNSQIDKNISVLGFNYLQRVRQYYRTLFRCKIKELSMKIIAA